MPGSLLNALPVLVHLNFPPSQDAGADEETEARGLKGHSGRVNSQWVGRTEMEACSVFLNFYSQFL